MPFYLNLSIRSIERMHIYVAFAIRGIECLHVYINFNIRAIECMPFSAHWSHWVSLPPQWPRSPRFHWPNVLIIVASWGPPDGSRRPFLNIAWRVSGEVWGIWKNNAIAKIINGFYAWLHYSSIINGLLVCFKNFWLNFALISYPILYSRWTLFLWAQKICCTIVFCTYKVTCLMVRSIIYRRMKLYHARKKKCAHQTITASQGMVWLLHVVMFCAICCSIVF